MFDERDKQLAKQLVENKDMLEFILKVLSMEDKVAAEVIIGKNNEELGEITRANFLAQEKLLTRYSKIKQLAQDTTGKSQKVPE
jgi:ABC-type thiamine transport system substrate-binding protein